MQNKDPVVLIALFSADAVCDCVSTQHLSNCTQELRGQRGYETPSKERKDCKSGDVEKQK